MEIRVAETDDATGMSRVLEEIIRVTGRQRASDTAFVMSNYIRHPADIRCSVAVGGTGEILGFQSLIRATAGNPYDVPEGWGIIGTHVDPQAHRQGIGLALFAVSRAAAADAGLRKITASINRHNDGALRYYGALGFATYREHEETVCKLLEL